MEGIKEEVKVGDDMANWMKYLRDETKVSALTLLGSHNAATYQTKDIIGGLSKIACC
jgi:hypothetical protein